MAELRARTSGGEADQGGYMVDRYGDTGGGHKDVKDGKAKW